MSTFVVESYDICEPNTISEVAAITGSEPREFSCISLEHGCGIFDNGATNWTCSKGNTDKMVAQDPESISSI